MGIRKYDPKNTKLIDVDLHEEADKWKKQQQADLVIDFDQALEESKAKVIEVRFDGQTYRLPATAPAWLILFINRKATSGGHVNDAENMQVIERLLGEEFLAKLEADGDNFISMQTVNDKILEPVFQKWGLTFEDASKNVTTPGS